MESKFVEALQQDTVQQIEENKIRPIEIRIENLEQDAGLKK